MYISLTLYIMLSQISNVDDMDELRKKIAVLSCELRKSQRLQNTCQVASDKLFAFVEVLQHLSAAHHSSFN